MIPIKIQNPESMDRCYKTVIDELKKMLDDAVNNGYIGKYQCKKKYSQWKSYYKGLDDYQKEKFKMVNFDTSIVFYKDTDDVSAYDDIIDKKTFDFFSWLQIDKNIKGLLFCSPNFFPWGNIKEQWIINELKNKKGNLFTFTKKVFIGIYTDKLNKAMFIDAIGTEVCPYCNRTFIRNVEYKDEEGKSGHVKGELDHFYSKDSYPHLALSVYNLVPSCPFCNHGKRNMPSAKLVNPYMLKSADDARFRMDIKDGGFVDLNKCADAIQIRLEDEKKVLGDNIKAFHLEELYNTHRDYAAEVYYKKKLRQNPTYYQFVMNLLEELHISSFSKEDISRILWGDYPRKEFNKRVLSKFLHDLYKY